MGENMKNPQVHICEPGLALSRILHVCILLINSLHHGYTQTVTCQQHESTVIPFHFPFVSGPEDLHVTFLKMESIGDTELTVIYALHNDAVEYYAAQYRNRTEIRTDLSSGKLDLILKDVEKSDEGIYKCQAANKKNYDEKTIQLYVEMKQRSIHTVTCQQHGEAKLTFHFPFISGPEDLDISFLKMESLGDTNPTVICTLKPEVSLYQADEYRFRTEIHTDLSSGKLDLILKDMKKSDEGIYKCQAANKKKHGENIIQLYIEQKMTTNTMNLEIWHIVLIYAFLPLTLLITFFITIKFWKRLSLRYCLASQKNPKKLQRSMYEPKPLNRVANTETVCNIDCRYIMNDHAEYMPLYSGRERQKNVNNEVINGSSRFSMSMRALHHLNLQNQMENVSLQEIPDRGEAERERAFYNHSSTSSLSDFSPKLRRRSGTGTRIEPSSHPPEKRRRSRSLSYEQQSMNTFIGLNIYSPRRT